MPEKKDKTYPSQFDKVKEISSRGFFWKNRKVGCSLRKENCCYLAESPKKHFLCEDC